uniref:Uncharacterized protein n=1 Tax=Arundo donax TaxID=35708 RepID=A0A0A9G404_ARUDO
MTARTVATSDASTHAIATRGGGDAALRPPMDLSARGGGSGLQGHEQSGIGI